MSGERFLVSLREVTNSERIIRCRSLVKADINFWKEDLGSDKPSLNFSALLALLSEHEIEFAESTLDSSSEEVSTTIAGYIAKKLAKRSNCDSCKSKIVINTFFNNKQTVSSDSARKDTVVAFKKRQRTK